jgi:hypothetical protein
MPTVLVDHHGSHGKNAVASKDEVDWIVDDVNEDIVSL